MPATLKMVRQLLAVYLVRDKVSGGGNTTLAADIAAGAGTFDLTSATNFAVGDILRLGAGEEMELVKIGALAGVTVTPAEATVYAHVAGEAIVEQSAYDLGDVQGEGVTMTFDGSTTDVQVATRRISYATMSGYVAAKAALKLPGITLFNLAAALGMTLASVTGSGTSSSPYHLVTDGSEFNNDANQSLIVISVLEDGTFLREELWGVDADYTGVTLALNRGNLASIPVMFVASAGGVVSTVANPYTAITTNRPSKGKVFDGLTEVGLFSAATSGPLATTTTAGVAAGATTLPLTAVTNLVAGDWVKVGQDENVEFHQIDSISTLDALLRTKVLRAQASGVAVVRQKMVAFADVNEEGVTVAVGGNVDPVKLATRKLQAGLRSSYASLMASFKVIGFSLTNFARSLGIPASAIVGGGTRLPLGNNVATDVQVDGVYIRGKTQDGSTVQVNLWGCANDVGAVAHTLTNAGAPPTLPLAFKPSSGIQFLQY